MGPPVVRHDLICYLLDRVLRSIACVLPLSMLNRRLLSTVISLLFTFENIFSSIAEAISSLLTLISIVKYFVWRR